MSSESDGLSLLIPIRGTFASFPSVPLPKKRETFLRLLKLDKIICGDNSKEKGSRSNKEIKKGGLSSAINKQGHLWRRIRGFTRFSARSYVKIRITAMMPKPLNVHNNSSICDLLEMRAEDFEGRWEMFVIFTPRQRITLLGLRTFLLLRAVFLFVGLFH